MSIEVFASAFLIGLLGAGHCLGMCGGITAALTFAIEDEQGKFQKVLTLVFYNIGRIGSYTAVGALFGWLGQTILQAWLQDSGMFILRSIAGALLILMGLYLVQLSKLLTHLEKAGALFWRYLQPIGQKLMPVKTPRQALLLGIVWGWLPCGLVYSTLAYASAQASTQSAALVMLAFGLGTFPAVFLGGIASSGLKALLQSQWFRGISAALLIVFGIWTIWAGVQHNHGSHSGHGHMAPIELQIDPLSDSPSDNLSDSPMPSDSQSDDEDPHAHHHMHH